MRVVRFDGRVPPRVTRSRFVPDPGGGVVAGRGVVGAGVIVPAGVIMLARLEQQRRGFARREMIMPAAGMPAAVVVAADQRVQPSPPDRGRQIGGGGDDRRQSAHHTGQRDPLHKCKSHAEYGGVRSRVNAAVGRSLQKYDDAGVSESLVTFRVARSEVASRHSRAVRSDRPRAPLFPRPRTLSGFAASSVALETYSEQELGAAGFEPETSTVRISPSSPPGFGASH